MGLPFPRDSIGRVYEEASASGSLSLAPIIEAVGGSYGLFFKATAAGGHVDEAFCHGVDDAYVHRLKEASVERMLPPWLGDLEPGSVFDRASFGSDQAFGRTAFFNHVIRPEGRFHCMIATPIVSRLSRFHLVIGRPRHKVEFDTEDRRLLQAMLPHVGQVIRLRAEIAATKASTRQLERAIDGLQTRMIVVAPDAALRFANREARRSLARRDAIHLDAKGRVTASSPHDTAHLRQVIAAVASGRRPEPATLELTQRPGDVPIEVIVTPIEDTENPSSLGGTGTLAMITIEPQDRPALRDHGATIARAHGLTRRESDLASLLVRGRTLPDASRELGMSYNTARSYLRQTFGKLDIHRQSELIRLFTTGRRPDADAGAVD